MININTLTKEEIYKMKPEEITLLLYQALHKNIEYSIKAIKRKDFGRANQKLQRSNEIVERLGAGINYEAGVIADQLHVLYNYMSDKLFQANLRKDVGSCQEVLHITNRITDGWTQAINQQKNGASKTPTKKNNFYEEQLDFEADYSKTVLSKQKYQRKA